MKKEIPENVKEYIAQFPEEIQVLLKQVQSIITKNAPGVEEKISYGMPGYFYHGALVYFAGHKNHIGFYATPTGHKKFAKQLSKYKQGKGSVQFPLDEELPVKLIEDIVIFRVKENLKKKKGK